MQREYQRLWYIKNRERLLEKASEYRDTHLEQIRSHNRAYSKKCRADEEWVKEHAARTRMYEHKNHKARMKTDMAYRLKTRLRYRMWVALHGIRKADKTSKLLGCTYEEFRNHLASQFIEGMSWDNYGEWHIDHINPCASYNLLDPEEQKKCFHYTNMQPLWAIDNIRKSNKIGGMNGIAGQGQGQIAGAGGAGAAGPPVGMPQAPQSVGGLPMLPR